MDRRTREYLAGRFGDHYRRHPPSIPPDPAAREWAYIPWSAGPETTMVRHRSLVDLGSLDSFLASERPQHVYYSAGRYRDPGDTRMAAKGWQGSDLIFDLDADHLPGVDPDETSYAAMLAECKRELQSLLRILRTDFAFEDVDIIFSGGRGYHVHVRIDRVQELGRDARRDIVDYVTGSNVSLRSIVETETVSGAGRRTPAERRTLDPTGGWSQRVHRSFLATIEKLRDQEPSQAIEDLRMYDGIGERRAEAILAAVSGDLDALQRGNIDVHPAILSLLEPIVQETVATHGAAIDEPVTTDLNRLIRLPGSLHGGSGLAVRPVHPDQVVSFDPLVEAIPETFRSVDISIEIPTPVELTIGGDSYSIAAGTHRVPEFVGIHLMTTGRARKAQEGSKSVG